MSAWCLSMPGTNGRKACHLEPDVKYQRQFLEATLRVKNGQSTLTGFTDTALPDGPSPGVLLDDLARLLRFGRTRTLAKTRAWFGRNPKAKAFAKESAVSSVMSRRGLAGSQTPGEAARGSSAQRFAAH